MSKSTGEVVARTIVRSAEAEPVSMATVVGSGDGGGGNRPKASGSKSNSTTTPNRVSPGLHAAKNASKSARTSAWRSADSTRISTVTRMLAGSASMLIWAARTNTAAEISFRKAGWSKSLRSPAITATKRTP
eukprot:scaffold11275_cov108-Isochrysis_galbana.AAC.3